MVGFYISPFALGKLFLHDNFFTSQIKQNRQKKSKIIYAPYNIIEIVNISDFITAFLQLDLKAWIWIGLTDRQNEGDYKWTDGTVFNYTNWQPREPSKLGSVGDDVSLVLVNAAVIDSYL